MRRNPREREERPGTEPRKRRCGGTRFLKKAGFPRTPSGKNFYLVGGRSQNIASTAAQDTSSPHVGEQLMTDAYTARYQSNTREVPIPVAAGVPAGRSETGEPTFRAEAGFHRPLPASPAQNAGLYLWRKITEYCTYRPLSRLHSTRPTIEKHSWF